MKVAAPKNHVALSATGSALHSTLDAASSTNEAMPPGKAAVQAASAMSSTGTRFFLVDYTEDWDTMPKASTLFLNEAGPIIIAPSRSMHSAPLSTLGRPGESNVAVMRRQKTALRQQKTAGALHSKSLPNLLDKTMTVLQGASLGAAKDVAAQWLMNDVTPQRKVSKVPVQYPGLCYKGLSEENQRVFIAPHSTKSPRRHRASPRKLLPEKPMQQSQSLGELPAPFAKTVVACASPRVRAATPTSGSRKFLLPDRPPQMSQSLQELPAFIATTVLACPSPALKHPTRRAEAEAPKHLADTPNSPNHIPEEQQHSPEENQVAPVPASPPPQPKWKSTRTLPAMSPATKLKGKERSAALMNSLYDLRRVGDPKHRSQAGGEVEVSQAQLKSDSTEEEEKQPEQLDVGDPTLSSNVAVGDPHGDDGSLLLSTLADKNDTPESLQQQADTLQNSRSGIKELGGQQHATSCVFNRALLCALRKIDLLETLRQKTEAFELEAGCRQFILEAVFAGEPIEKVASELLGFEKVIERSVHQRGEPQDANKSDFKSFAKSFGLPSEHAYVVRARSLLDETQDNWAQAALNMGEEQAASSTGEKLVTVAKTLKETANLLTGMGCSPDLPAVRRLLFLALECRGRVCEYRAQKEFDADARTCQARESAGKCMPSGPATEASERILKEVKDAMKAGVPGGNPSLGVANKLAQSLREADGLRKRAEAAEKRKRDAAERAKKNGS